MPVADGLLENKPVQALRDTGCSAVIVRRSLVSETKLTGQEARCVLIDGTIRRAPVAQVFIDKPYFTGTTTAVCMEKPLYDVIVGNIPGATNPTLVQPASAVQTRSQATATKDHSPVTAPPLDLEPEDTVTTIPRAKVFQELKKRNSSPPILRLPDVSQPFILHTDASHLGVGAVLLQENTAGEKRPIAFASRKLLPRESRYSTIERECLAITWGVKKFQEYLYGTEFILETDHQPLQYLRQAKLQNGRLMRWALASQPYRFLLRAIRGRDNVEADCLSRNPLED